MTVTNDESLSHRYVLLGASNLTMSFPLLLQNLIRTETPTVEIHAALGHGRSFAGWSRVFWRGLPGIVECDLWNDISTAGENGPRRTRALITDIGNDLLYGYAVTEIVAIVSECMQQLQQHDAEIVLTLPPLAAVRKLSRWRFGLVRRVMFPACHLSFREIVEAAHRLTESLTALGGEHGIPVFAPPDNWYGFDPIHIRRRCRSEAWRAICSLWSDFPTGEWLPNPSRGGRRSFRRTRPAHYRWRGRGVRVPQPTLHVDTGSLSLY